MLMLMLILASDATDADTARAVLWSSNNTAMPQLLLKVVWSIVGEGFPVFVP